LLELAAETGATIDEEKTREGLGSYSTGKANKVAKTLLAMKPLSPGGAREAAAVHAATSRIARAERWLRWSPERFGAGA
jgi:Lon protease-like protein